MDLGKLFELISQYESANFTLWNMYIAVVIAIIGYAIGTDRVKNNTTRIILAAGFLAFAFGNSNYLERNQILINAAASEISIIVKLEPDSGQKLSVNFQDAISKWESLQPQSLRIMHHAIDAIVILLILFGHHLMSIIRQNISDKNT